MEHSKNNSIRISENSKSKIYSYLQFLKNQNKISNQQLMEIRKLIQNAQTLGQFFSKAELYQEQQESSALLTALFKKMAELLEGDHS